MTKAAKKQTPEVLEPETKDVATQTQGGVLATVAPPAPLGSDVVASDILVPRLLLMQGISPLVTMRKAQIGDFIRSSTGEKLGDVDKPLDIIPLKMVNTWINFETAQSAKTTQPQFRGQEPRGKISDGHGGYTTNEHLDFNFKGPQGQEMFRRKAVSLFALIPADVAAYEAEIARAIDAGEAPDLTKSIMPVIITFQSTAFKHAGRKCATFFNTVKKTAAELRGRMEIVPWNYSLTLLAKEEKKGTNMWYVFDLGPQKPVKDKAIIAQAAQWAANLASSNVKTDDSGEVDEDNGAATSGAAEMEV